MTRRTSAALHWIYQILKKHRIKFMITGGFATRTYGSNRTLADIDIEIHNTKFPLIESSVHKYIVYGPKRYKDKTFDVLLMTLKYEGQLIDICGSDSEKLFDKENDKWYKEHIDLNNDVSHKKVYDLVVPMEKVKSLIKYKKKISRRVDIQDVRALERKKRNLKKKR